MMRPARILLGYMKAVAVSGLCFSALVTVVSIVNYDPAVSIDASRSTSATGIFLMLLLLGTPVIFVLAIPAWLAAVIIAEWQRIRSLSYYLVYGTIAGLPYLLTSLGGEPAEPAMIGAIALSGLAGGWTYWRNAGISAGTRSGSS